MQFVKEPSPQERTIADNEFFKVTYDPKRTTKRIVIDTPEAAKRRAAAKENEDVKFLTTLVGFAASAAVLHGFVGTLPATSGLRAATQLSLNTAERGAAALFGGSRIVSGAEQLSFAKGERDFDKRFGYYTQAGADVLEGALLLTPAASSTVATGANIGFEALARKPSRKLVERNPDLRARATYIAETKKGILLVKETSGQYGLPGGGIGKGEKALRAVIRELKEETGLRPVKKPRLKYEDFTGTTESILPRWNVQGRTQSIRGQSQGQS